MKHLLVTVLIMICSSLTLFSGETGNYTKHTNIGLSAGLNINMHSPSFSYPDTDGLGSLDFKDNANGLDFFFGFKYNAPITEDYIFSGRLVYNSCGGVLETSINDLTSAFDISLSYLEISPMIQFHNLLPVEPLYLLGGLEFGLPIGDKKLETFEITDASFRMAIGLGAGYVIPVSDDMCLTPELSFRLPVTGVSSNDNFDSWSMPQIRLGVSLTFDMGEDIVVEEHKSNLNAGFKDVRYYDKEGNTYPLKKIKVEEIQYKELFPLVSYVFCDENEAKPAVNAQELSEASEAGQFNLTTLEPDAVKINIKTLDIIGDRMAKYTGSKLNIKGTMDGKGEKDNETLAFSRAEYAKNYIVKTYKISPDRISTSAGYPDKPSSSKVDDGVAENRRIELSSDDARLLEPIVIKGDRKSIATPNLLEFEPYAESNDSISSWKMEISRGDVILRTYTGKGPVHSVKWLIYPNEIDNNELPLEYYLQVENSYGLEVEETGSIPVEYYSYIRKKEEKLPDRTISKFSLILFDFDNADVSEQDMKIINEQVIPAIKYNSTVKIYGYTDRIGSEEYNKNLAKRRAESVKQVLMQKVKDAKYKVYGVGYNQGLFDNEEPLGRHLSRTVQVFVETPR